MQVHANSSKMISKAAADSHRRKRDTPRIRIVLSCEFSSIIPRFTCNCNDSCYAYFLKCNYTP